MTGASLGDSFRRLIAATGPVSVARFMGEANAHYYGSRDPLGAAGDFVTAPEISQMFGELVGLWLADAWDRAGRPAHVRYLELGPGRGTLAKDALRAMARAGLTPEVHFVEGSPALRRVQQAAVPDATIHDDLAAVPEGAPLLLVANEFLDALPVRQLVATAQGWRERMIGMDPAGRLRFESGDRPMDGAVAAERCDAVPGTIIESNPAAAAVVEEIARRLDRDGGAALLIDYGYAAPRTGSTLQAVSGHRKVDPLAAPGEADLTALVDFSALADVATARGARWLGTMTQGSWLTALGIGARAAALAQSAPAREAELTVAVARLTAPDQMGDLFKVMGLAGNGWPGGAGFA